MININLTLLILFHVIADFYLQSQIIADKKNNSYKYVVYHSVLYLIAYFFIFLFFKITFILFFSILLIGVSHFVIDSIKYKIISKKGFNSSSLFIIDQILHISILVVLFLLVQKTNYILLFERFNVEQYSNYIKGVTAVLIIFKPSNVLIKSFLTLNQYSKNTTDKNEEPIRLGRLIGNLERLLILLSLLANQYVVIGFIFTAKSIVRWEKLKEKNFAEYYLIGTLLSVVIPIIAYYIFLKNISL